MNNNVCMLQGIQYFETMSSNLTSYAVSANYCIINNCQSDTFAN